MNQSIPPMAEKSLNYRVTRKFEGKISAEALVLNLIRAHAG